MSQKLGIFLENKMSIKLKLSKNVVYKKMIFDKENWLWKSDFGFFDNVNVGNITISFEDIDFGQKNIFTVVIR